MNSRETVRLMKRKEAEFELADMTMLGLAIGVVRVNNIRNEQIRGHS